MQNLAFTGLLSVSDNTKSRILNTDFIVLTEENKDDRSVTVTMINTPPFRLGYTYAEVEKALIEARKNGYCYLEHQDSSASSEQTSKEEPKEATIETLTVETGVPVDASGEKKEPQSPCNVFDYIPRELSEHRQVGGAICPNSLSNYNFCCRNGKMEYLSDEDYEIARAVDAAFEQIEGLPEDRVFYRALSGDNLPEEIMEAKEGDIIVPDKGYAQVTPNKDMIGKYLPSESLNPVLFEIRCKKGSKVCLVPGRLTGSGYSEGMMQGSAKYKVLSKEKTDFEYSYFDILGGGYKTATSPVTKFVLELV